MNNVRHGLYGCPFLTMILSHFIPMITENSKAVRSIKMRKAADDGKQIFDFFNQSHNYFQGIIGDFSKIALPCYCL